MSEEAFKVIGEYGSYYLTEEGMYIRMYGCSRAPSLLPQYETDYAVHKEAVRQVYLDGVGSFLFEHKKAAYPAIPFWGLGLELLTMIITTYTSCTSNAMGSKPGCYNRIPQKF